MRLGTIQASGKQVPEVAIVGRGRRFAHGPALVVLVSVEQMQANGLQAEGSRLVLVLDSFRLAPLELLDQLARLSNHSVCLTQRGDWQSTAFTVLPWLFLQCFTIAAAVSNIATSQNGQK